MITLNQAIIQIKKANPLFGSIYDSQEKFIDYVHNKITRHEFHPTYLKRQQPYRNFIKEQVDRLFKTEDVKVNFDEDMILDTTAHHNILNYPAVIGAHMVTHFDTILDREKMGDYYVLDCGNVSFSEVLHKRGVEFGGKHINLYPKKDKNMLVSRYSLYKFDLMAWVKKSGHTYDNEHLNFVKHFQEIINQIDFSTCNRLSDQIVKINYYLWQEFFSPELKDKVRRCITLEHDEILINYLIKFLAEGKDNFIWRALFDKEFRQEVFQEFKGIYGAWDYSGPNTGTHIFWGFNHQDGKEYRLELINEMLVDPKGGIKSIPMTQEGIIKGLSDGILVPSIFLKFGLVNYYMGTKTVGGPGQTEYVGKLLEAWKRVMSKFDTDETELLDTIDVTGVNTVELAFSRNTQGDIVSEWGWDIAMNHRFSKDYLEHLKKVEYRYLLYPFIPISYYRLTPAKERQRIEYKNKELYRGFDWIK